MSKLDLIDVHVMFISDLNTAYKLLFNWFTFLLHYFIINRSVGNV